jgi:hypothetical protein
MWIYNDQVLESPPEGYVGFVYIITNMINNKKYIGKKLFYFSKTKKVKGKNKRFKFESDWKDYYGSNEELKTEVEKLGKTNYKREILYLCKSKGMMSYLESKEIFLRDCLLSNEYYNVWVSCKIRKSHVKI